MQTGRMPRCRANVDRSALSAAENAQSRCCTAAILVVLLAVATAAFFDICKVLALRPVAAVVPELDRVAPRTDNEEPIFGQAARNVLQRPRDVYRGGGIFGKRCLSPPSSTQGCALSQ